MTQDTEMRTCPNCKAYYRKSTHWYRGYYKGTSSIFNPTSRIPENKCPICRKEEPSEAAN